MSSFVMLLRVFSLFKKEVLMVIEFKYFCLGGFLIVPCNHCKFVALQQQMQREGGKQ